MEVISEELVDESRQEVAMFNTSRITKGIKELSKQQPHLLSFMLELTKDLDLEVRELSVYIFYNVYRMFKLGYQKRINKISSKDIIGCYEDNEKFIESLDGTHDKLLERITGIQVSEQPYVMKYVVDTLVEVPEDEYPIELSKEDAGYLFLLLKTVIDLLNKTTNI
ncbi:hypothetical protein [Desulfobacterium sp. N47]|uniref:Uncharacterized protein n=1 Tax=uncultured Desulfobacterium sp. TaxID=201089 RepID=E1YLM9_9BACT|nr:unknown protein [uncultured Desulfobacterium sp.]